MMEVDPSTLGEKILRASGEDPSLATNPSLGALPGMEGQKRDMVAEAMVQGILGNSSNGIQKVQSKRGFTTPGTVVKPLKVLKTSSRDEDVIDMEVAHDNSL